MFDNKIIKNDSIAFDHPDVIIYGLKIVKNRIEYTDIVFNMMLDYFNLGKLQQVYTVILNKKLHLEELLLIKLLKLIR